MVKRNWMWGLLAVALLVPAVASAATVMTAGESCPVPCENCPFKK